MSKNRLIVKGNNLFVLQREVIESSLTALSGNLVDIIVHCMMPYFLSPSLDFTHLSYDFR